MTIRWCTSLGHHEPPHGGPPAMAARSGRREAPRSLAGAMSRYILQRPLRESTELLRSMAPFAYACGCFDGSEHPSPQGSRIHTRRDDQWANYSTRSLSEQELSVMKPTEFQRWLKKRGCSFESHKGGSGHLTVRRGDRTSQLPMHGSRRELGTKLMAKIKKDLGL